MASATASAQDADRAGVMPLTCRCRCVSKRASGRSAGARRGGGRVGAVVDDGGGARRGGRLGVEHADPLLGRRPDDVRDVHAPRPQCPPRPCDPGDCPAGGSPRSRTGPARAGRRRRWTHCPPPTRRRPPPGPAAAVPAATAAAWSRRTSARLSGSLLPSSPMVEWKVRPGTVEILPATGGINPPAGKSVCASHREGLLSEGQMLFFAGDFTSPRRGRQDFLRRAANRGRYGTHGNSRTD